MVKFIRELLADHAIEVAVDHLFVKLVDIKAQFIIRRWFQFPVRVLMTSICSPLTNFMPFDSAMCHNGLVVHGRSTSRQPPLPR